MMEAVLGPFPERTIKDASRTAGKYFTYRCAAQLHSPCNVPAVWLDD